MKRDNLDAMGKTNRLLLPLVFGLLALLMIAGFMAKIQDLTSGRALSDRDFAQLAGAIVAFVSIGLSLMDLLRKTNSPRWLYLLIGFAWGASQGYAMGGPAGAGWSVGGMAVLVLIAVLAFRRDSVAQFGRAGIKE